ncbi:MAG: hypothetical protein RLZZ383_1464 [Pseudomonadota bacterium]
MLFFAWLVACDALQGPDEDVAEAVDTWTPPDARGTWEAGVTTLTYLDPRGRTLEIEVWYPAVPQAGDTPDPYPELPITIGAYRDAPPADGAFPLVAFSHGFGGIRYQSPTLTEHLARHGYVVTAPDHEGTILLFLDWDEMDRHVLERPDDVRFAVDATWEASRTGHPLLGGHVAGSTYALVGHSFGAVTALVVGGAEPDFPAVAAYCDANDGLQGCDYLPDIDPADVAGHGTVDPRAEALVAMSPGGWYAYGADGANLAATVPSLVLSGDNDGVLNYEAEQRPTWERMGTPTSLVTFADAGHYGAFSDMCRLLATFEDCKGPDAGFLDSDRGKALTTTLVTAFLDARWRGETRAAAWLAPETVQSNPELTFETREAP